MLKIEDLNFEYKNKVLFKNAEVEIFKNKLHIIVGPNGAGKSTLLKIITGNIKADCKILNDFKNIFYLPQNPYYPKDVTTFDYVSSIFFKNNFKWFLNKEEEALVNEALFQMELEGKKDLRIEDLSAGELQKANIALGLLSGADLFLLDEPSSNMDLINEIKILDKLQKLSQEGITSVVIMHDLNLASNYGDYFIGIGGEYKILMAESEEFFKSENLKRLYNIDFEIIGAGDKKYVQIIK